MIVASPDLNPTPVANAHSPARDQHVVPSLYENPNLGPFGDAVSHAFSLE